MAARDEHEQATSAVRSSASGVRQRRIEHVAQTIAHHVQAPDDDQHCSAGNGCDVRGGHHELATVGQHRPEVGGWRLGAESDKAEARCLDDERADIDDRKTSSGGAILGRTSRDKIRTSLAPNAREASMNAARRTTRTADRTPRA